MYMIYEVYVFIGYEISYISQFKKLQDALALVDQINNEYYNKNSQYYAMWRLNFRKGI